MTAAAGILVFHIMHDAGEGSPYDVRAEIGQISDQVAPVPGEPVIVKNYPNSFVGTDLDARLRQAPGRELILAGFMTHMCVNSTARGAFNLGYHPTVVASATATRELPPTLTDRAPPRPGREGQAIPGFDHGTAPGAIQVQEGKHHTLHRLTASSKHLPVPPPGWPPEGNGATLWLHPQRERHG